MKISEITLPSVAAYLNLTAGDYDAMMLTAVMSAAKQYIVDYTGIPESSADETVDTIDNHPDFYAAYMVICQDMNDNRSMYVGQREVANKVVDSILGMHCVNLL